MARSATAGQITALTALDRQELVRLQIEDHAATLQDYTVAGGADVDWFDTATLRDMVDQRAMSATVTMQREIAGTSLAPRMNANPPIKAGREIVISTAVIGQGDTVTGADWIEKFRGRVDNVAWGGDDSVMVLECRDQFGRLIDAWVETEANYGNTAAPEALETVAQEILDDVFGASVITLTTPTSPSFGLVEFTQRLQSSADALGAMVDLIGWDVRYVWDSGSSSFKLTLYEPDRSKTTPDLTLDADDYFTVRDISESTENIRNVGIIEWADGSFVTVEDTTSIAEYGRRPIFFDSTQDPQISNSTKATNLVTAAVSDLAQPLIGKVVEGPYDWRPELGDLVRWTANSVHASSDLDAAIVGLEHTLTPGGCTTVYYTRGKPSGGNRRWHRKERRRKVASATREIFGGLPDVEIQAVSRDASGNVQIDVKGGPYTSDVYITYSIGDGTTEPSDPTATDDAVGGRSGRLDTATPADPGQIVWVKARGVDSAGTLAPTANIAEAKHEVAGVPDGSVDNDSFSASLKIAVDKIVAQAAGFSTDIGIRAHASDEDRIAWDTGTIWYADGTSDAVTGNANALVNANAGASGTWYVYWNGTAMAYTQTWSTLLSATANVLLATVSRASASVAWTVIPSVGVLGVTGPPIQTEHLTASAITADKIAANAITTAKLDALSVTAAKIAANTITASQIAAGTITATEIASGTITADEIATGTITADEIAASTITADKLTIASLSAITATLGTVVAGLINNAASNPTAGIRLDSGSSKPGTWTNYLDLAATSTGAFLVHASGLQLNADGTATWPGAIENPPQLLSAGITVTDDGTDDDYSVTWTYNDTANDSAYRVQVECYRENVLVETSTNHTVSTGSTIVTDTGGGDGASDSHYVVLTLYRVSDSATMHEMVSRTILSAI